MPLFFTITLAISIVGLLGLLGLKRYELATGHLVFAHTRPRVGNFFHRGMIWIESVLPGLLRDILRDTGRRVRMAIQKGVAWLVLLVEHNLEAVLHTIRTTMTEPPPGTGEVSVFLREVAEHKKKLLKHSRAKRTIVEE